MILDSLQIDPAELERRTGWAIKPEGACKGDRCVPLPETSTVMERPVRRRSRPAGTWLPSVDAQAFAERLRMPLVHNEAHDLWCLGPQADAPPLDSAEAPNFTLPDHEGNDFTLESLRGQKVFLLAWASW